jgi:hypothetical protein
MVRAIQAPSVPTFLDALWREGYFKKERTRQDVATKLASRGSNPTPENLRIALIRAKFLTRRGKTGSHHYIQKHPAKTPAPATGVLPDALAKKLAKSFKTELADLQHNYGVSGNCTAFLLRKILEKLIFVAFAANGMDSLLRDANGNLVGLTTMLNLATTSKVAGKPFLLPKTASAIQGVKFLGDTAAHSPLANVSVQTIQPNMPYIITAFEELVTKLP